MENLFRPKEYPVQPYPDDNDEKLSYVFGIMTKMPESVMHISTIFEYLGWEENKYRTSEVKILLQNCGIVEVKGSGGLVGYKLTEEGFFNITKHGNYLSWRQSIYDAQHRQQELEREKNAPREKADAADRFQKRYWWAIELGKILLGFILGYVVGKLS